MIYCILIIAILGLCRMPLKTNLINPDICKLIGHMKINWSYEPEGLSLRNENITLLTLGMHSLTKENSSLDNAKLKSFAKMIIDSYLSKGFSFNNNISAKNLIDESPIFLVSDFEEYKGQYLYKYINGDSLNYYRKGHFQLGSLDYFKQMENTKARDELEGLAFINTKMNNRSANCALRIGRNYCILCGTDQDTDSLSNYHVENFGSVLLKIDLEPFIKRVFKKIGAKTFKIFKVNYSNVKLIKTELPITITPETFSNFDSAEMQTYLGHLIEQCTTPCLFTKPGWFKPENEVRIVFEMSNDCSSTQPTRFKDKLLLKHLTFFE